MKKLFFVLSALSLIPSLISASEHSYNPTRASRATFLGGRGAHGYPRSFATRGASPGLGSRLSGSVVAGPQPVYPGIPPVGGAIIRDPSMFVRQEPTGEGARFFPLNAGGSLIASDGNAQALGGAGTFIGRPDNQIAANSGSNAPFGTFFGNSSGFNSNASTAK